MFKNIILAVLIAIVLTYSLGHLSTQWFDFHFTLAEHHFEPFSSILALTGLVALLVVVGFVVAFSLVAVVVLTFIAGGIGLFVVGLSAFWPVILLTLVIFLLVRDKQTPAY